MKIYHSLTQEKKIGKEQEEYFRSKFKIKTFFITVIIFTTFFVAVVNYIEIKYNTII